MMRSAATRRTYARSLKEIAESQPTSELLGSSWRRRNTWPKGNAARLFVGKAIELIGQAKFGDSWSGKEFEAQRSVIKLPTFEGTLIHHFDRLINPPPSPFGSSPSAKESDSHQRRTPLTRERIRNDLKRLGEQLAAENEELRPQYEAALAAWKDLQHQNEMARERLEWVINWIGQKGRDGELASYLRPVNTDTQLGYYAEVPAAFWETENLLWKRFKETSLDFKLASSETSKGTKKPKPHFIFLDRESVDVQIVNLDAERGPAETEPLHYSIYMQLMRRAIQHFDVTATNQPKASALIAYFEEHWPATVEESARLTAAMATLVRDPESQKGRGLKLPNKR